MSNLKELLEQKAALDQLIAETRQRETAGAIAQVRSIVTEFGLSSADIFGGKKTAEKKTSKVAPKYRDPLSGNTWTGRGIAPKWLAGKNKDDYLIA
ncbi:MAG: hypothetical protein RLZZ591_2915 [Pseudomonadota bacterium]|jgi:DNA-binding protein H-NS